MQSNVKYLAFFLTPVVKAACFPISSNPGLEKLVPQSLLYGYGLTFTHDFPRYVWTRPVLLGGSSMGTYGVAVRGYVRGAF